MDFHLLHFPCYSQHLNIGFVHLGSKLATLGKYG